MKYKKSVYLQEVSYNGKSMIWHSLFNRPMVFTENSLELLNFFEKTRMLNEAYEIYQGDIKTLLDTFIDNYYIIEESFDERKFLKEKQEKILNQILNGENLSRLELVISNQCNLGCPYCLHFKNNHTCKRRDDRQNMSKEVAKKSIDRFLQKLKEVGNKDVRIHFGNGEPLLNWEIMKFCMEYTSNIKDFDFTYAVNTNLTLLDLEKALVLKKYNVSIGTSIDGLKEEHDKIRKTLNGEGTFDKVHESMLMLKSIDYPLESFSITVTEKNFKSIDYDLIDFAYDMGLKGISIDFDLVDTTNISAEDSVNLILRLRKYAFGKGLDFNGTWETPYRHLMFYSWLDGPYAFCPAMEGNTVEFGTNGNLKVCGHTNTVVGNTENFNDIFTENGSYGKLIKSRQTGNNMNCLNCPIEGCCTGQCHVTLESSKKNPKLMKNMCKYMKLMTKSLIEDYLKNEKT